MIDNENLNSNIHLVVTNAWIQKDNKYLVAQRSLEDNYKPWFRSIVWGKLDYTDWNNALEQNIIKEIKEEVWIEVDDVKMIWNRMWKTKTTVLYITFLCKRKSWDAQALDDTEKVERMTIEEMQNFKEPNFFKDYLNYIQK